MSLSILIPSLSSRAHLLDKLVEYLNGQIKNEGLDCEILTSIDNGEVSVGKKRQDLIESASKEYLCFIDDDDSVVYNYIKTIKEKMNGADCMGFLGLLRTDGKREELFCHSNRYSTWEKRGHIYVRPINHLNPIKAKIARKIGYKDLRRGEDQDYSMRLKQSGQIKIESFIENIMYVYNYNTKKDGTTFNR